MKQKKLLILGNSIGTKDALQYAKALGVTTIVTDNVSPEQCQEKRLSDEYWMVDVNDLDALEKKCREEQIDGVFAATGEHCLSQARSLCRRLELTFYASEKGWRAARDKQYFKNVCRQVGLEVPKEYQLETAVFPVVVKPVDSCAQQGLFMCSNQEELLKSYGQAVAVSPSGRTIIEEYVSGDELCCWYLFRKGHAKIISVSDVPYMTINGRNNFSKVFYRSRFYEEYMKNVHTKVTQLFSVLGCEEGVGYIQVIRQKGIYYLLEFGYRLESIGAWRILETLTGFNSLKWQVQLALGENPETAIKMPEEIRKDGKVGMTYFIWGKPGIVHRIEGVKKIKALEGVDFFLESITEGTEILQTDSMRQIVYIISFVVADMSELQKKIDFVRKHLHAYDMSGEDLLICS